MKIQRWAVVAAVLIWAASAWGSSVPFGVVTTTRKLVFEIDVYDTLGRQRNAVKPDSFVVDVWASTPAGTGAATYHARSGNATPAWIRRTLSDTGDSCFVFVDSIADMDSDSGNGSYTGAVRAWVQGYSCRTTFSFTLAANDEATMSGRIDAAITTRLSGLDADTAMAGVKTKLTTITTGVNATQISGSTATADNLEATFDSDSSTFGYKIQTRQLQAIANNGSAGMYVKGDGGGAGLYADGGTTSGTGIDALGHGVGSGMDLQAGASGNGMHMQSTIGAGWRIQSDAGHGIQVEGGTDSTAVVFTGYGTGSGLRIDGGASGGAGVTIYGNNNAGMEIYSQVGGYSGLYVSSDSGSGVQIRTVYGPVAALSILAGEDANAIAITTSGTGDGITITSPGTGDAIDASAGSDGGGYDINADINGSVATATALGAAERGTIAESLVTHFIPAALADTTFGGAIREMHDSLDTQGWAATGAAAGGITETQMRAMLDTTFMNSVRGVIGDTFNVVSGAVVVASVNGLGDTLRDVIGDSLTVLKNKLTGFADSLRDVIGDTFNVVSGAVIVASVNGLGDTLRDVVGDTFAVYPHLSTAGVAAAVWNALKASYITTGSYGVGVFIDTNTTGHVGVSATELVAIPIATVTTVTALAAAERAAIADSVSGNRVAEYTSDTTLGGAVKYLRDSVGKYTRQLRDTVNVHSPHGNDWASAGSQTWSTAQRDSALQATIYAKASRDTVVAHAPHANNWGGTASVGTGAQTLTITVIDTSGTDATVSSVKVSVHNFAQTTIIGTGLITGAGGTTTVNVDASTAYAIVAYLPGFTFPVFKDTTGSGATFSDTVQGYNIDIGSPASASLKRVYGYEYRAGDSLQGLSVVATLITPPPTGDSVIIDTVSHVQYAAGMSIEAETVASGKWILDLPLNIHIKPSGSRWKITCKEVWGGIRWSVTVNLTTTATDCIGHITNPAISCP